MAQETEIGDVLERPRAAPRAPAQPRKAQPAAIPPKPRAKPMDGYDKLNANGWPILGVILCGLGALGIIGFALYLIDAWSKV